MPTTQILKITDMKKFILLSIICFFTNLSNAQIDSYGFEYSRNFSTQLNFNPQKSFDGTTQWNTLSSNGLGIFLSYKIPNTKFNAQTNIKYIRKGFVEKAQLLKIPGNFQSIYDNEFNNTFDYLNFDFRIAFNLLNTYDYSLSPYIGIRNSFLISKSLESDIKPINFFYPMKYYKDFNKYNIGYMFGLSLKLSNLLIIEGETNLDFNHVIKTDILEVKNWVGSINFGFNISELLKIAHKKKSRLSINH